MSSTDISLFTVRKRNDIVRMSKKIVQIFTIGIITLLSFSATAQEGKSIDRARMYYDLGSYKEAIEVYDEVYKKNKTDRDVFNGYLDALLAAKEYKQAEKLVEGQLDMQPGNPILLIDLGRVLLADDKKNKKAHALFEDAVETQNGSDMLTQQIAQKFISIEQDEYALKTYEFASEMLGNKFLYSGPMSRLYYKTGNLEQAIYTLLDASKGYFNGGVEEVKATLLEYLGDDRKKLMDAQKALIKKINQQPDNPYYSELLTWLFTQKDDWEGAMMQVRALDARYKEQGERMLEFARYAVKEEQYDYALKAYDEVIEENKDYPFYAAVIVEQLDVKFRLLKQTPDFTSEQVQQLANEYKVFLDSFEQYYSTPTVQDYAALQARYANNPEKAIELLEKAIKHPQGTKLFIGKSKLQLGDYFVLVGRIWDASLMYSQVDKSFREDMLGEEARFRNAKLAYYRSDFEWAEGQLSVLKASTSELIANDALYLSVLITENIPPDSNYLPLERYAYADLLLFQNKDEEAEKLLDSIATNFPEHPLQDDILMMRSDIAVKHREYEKALSFLQKIYEDHGKDVLADDALYTMAEINEKYLGKKEEAGKLYAQLILEYPGSTYIQLARKRVKELDPDINS